MIYLMVFIVTQNCLQMMFHYLHNININKATDYLHNDPNKIAKWSFQWKISYNLDIFLQVHEPIFSRKGSKIFHPLLTLNNIPVAQTNSPKNLGMQLDKKLNFEEHLSKVESKVNKTMDTIPKFINGFPRLVHLTIYNSCISLLLDYGGIILIKLFN